ncbi:HNH endonuclease [Methanosphaera sp. ISO3-F5]|uniref:HNH endonuclease n=1 Tax=Methanosphaera sp. ISO3-F5 TaxID=1452353 RepID=UPI002B25E729|nr:HNH endonuclease [Methanosphaera sp. ISO3-F5]WQH64140.1 HNH endonuclease [Methanosphaera sp. ISO3-F5]
MTNNKYFISKMWASDIKKRDSKRCILCGSKKELEAHHIFGISQYPYLTTELNNGITLCKKCHNNYHKQYNEVNAITWTQFLLKNQYNITNMEINYSNGYKETISLPTNSKNIQPLQNNNIKSTILQEIKTSKFADTKIPYKWLITQLKNKYGINNEKITHEIKQLETKGIIAHINKNELELII